MPITITPSSTTLPESVAFDFTVDPGMTSAVSVRPFNGWNVAGFPVANGTFKENGGNVINTSKIISRRFDKKANFCIPFNFPVLATVTQSNVIGGATSNVSHLSAKIDIGSFEIVETPLHVQQGKPDPV